MSKNKHLNEAEVIGKYKSGVGSTTLGRHYGVTRKTISDILKRNSVERRGPLVGFYRKLEVDEHFFDTINTEAKAYFLGLMFADGYVYDTCNNACVALQEEDRYILSAFSQAVYSKDRTLFLDKKNPRWKQQYRICFHSKILRDALISHGCVPRKSLVLDGPIGVPDSLIHHFIRGFFDGDGHMGNNVMSFTTTMMMGEWLQDIFKRFASIDKCFFYQMYNKKTYSVNVYSKSDRMKLCNFIYKDATIYLERKFVKRVCP